MKRLIKHQIIRLKEHSGSALLLALFIMTSIMIVAFSGATTILTGLKTSGTETRSFKAYFGAEAGAEHLLWEVRKNGYDLGVYSATSTFTGTLENSASYLVDYKSFNPIIFTSVGSYGNTKRSVEISF